MCVLLNDFFQITEKRLRDLFSQKGHITDVQLKYTKEGVFRKFAFIGFQSDDEASAAARHFDKTCINTSRVAVEICTALGADAKPKSWSKYSADSSAFQKLHGTKEKPKDENENTEETTKKNEKIKKSKDERMEEILGEHKNDPKFIEFMKVHSKGADKWNNDFGLADLEEGPSSTTPAARKNQAQVDAEDGAASGDDDDNDDADEADEDDDEQPAAKLADQEISDTDYLRKLMNKPEGATETTTQPKVKKEKAAKSEPTKVDLFTIKIREIPFTTKRKDVIGFFKPVRPYSIRLPTRSHGFCYVGFKTEKEFNKAMLKNRSFLKGKQVLFLDFTEKNKEAKLRTAGDGAGAAEASVTAKTSKWAKQEEALKDEEDISESGRIFFRNLAYTVTEDVVQAHFEKYGPIAEINVPIDTNTRQIKGFGIVTFLMPEHAVKAFAELDGTIFHGRLLHLIPGKSKDSDQTIDADAEGLSFKQKKELKQKETAGSSHNWNTLFLGANAVADLLAKNYQTTKEQIMDTKDGGSSAAVRLALGETELIIQMRKFLEDNDVVLDVFDQVAKKRSKTVILAKNLPASTRVDEIQPLFAKFGLLGRVVLPASGVTALIEFLEPSEARVAFRKLAYSKFKHLPLYLEWAPENVFKAPATKPMAEVQATDASTVTVATDAAPAEPVKKRPNAFSKQNAGQTQPAVPALEREVVNEPTPMQTDDNANESEDETEPEPETTLFLRNLNFNTREPAVRAHFKHIGKIHEIQVAMKKDPQDPKNRIPLGYGFIQFKLKSSTENALKTMQFTSIEGNSVELKRSDRTLQ